MISPEFPAFPQLVNRFTVGADPEFALLNPTDNTVMGAQACFMLSTNLAWGADGAGRPVELRPYASRWILEVVASLFEEMEKLATHLARVQLSTQKSWLPTWTSRPTAISTYVPCGGHLHFGRRLSNGIQLVQGAYIPSVRMKEELLALDRILDMMIDFGLFNSKEVALRSGGDYGTRSEWRRQSYGYEYRTWPTWLASPELAMIALTLGKIAVINPHLVLDFPPTGNALEAIATHYSQRDSDSYLLNGLLSRPKEEILGFGKNTNIQSSWVPHFEPPANVTLEKSPIVLQPRRQTLALLWNRFLRTPLQTTAERFKTPQLDVSTVNPLALDDFSPVSCAYLPAFEGLVAHKSFPVDIYFASTPGEEQVISENPNFGFILTGLLGIRSRPQLPIQDKRGLALSICQYNLDKRCKLLLRLQAAGLMPMWWPWELTNSNPLPKWEEEINNLVGGKLCVA